MLHNILIPQAFERNDNVTCRLCSDLLHKFSGFQINKQPCSTNYLIEQGRFIWSG
jgi:hypothetical protein